MPTFSYVAKTQAGKLEKGTTEAEDEKVLRQRLQAQGYFPTEVKQVAAKAAAGKGKVRAGMKADRRLQKMFGALVAEAEKRKPDAVVLVDFPGFNLRFAAQMKRRGIKVFYFGRNGSRGHVDGVGGSVIIVGRSPSGNLAGVRTIAIWT